MQLKEFKAKVSDNFLDKVDRVFDASPKTVYNELLQNSRRAGATIVRIAVIQDDDDILVHYEDNGGGVEDPEILLHLASSEWDTGAAKEDPAGMGFFCLSAMESVHVQSRDWEAFLTPDMFKGKKLVRPMTLSRPFEAGVRIKFSVAGADSKAWRAAVHSPAEYCGMTVFCGEEDGAETMLAPKGFMDDCIHELEFAEGYSIGVTDYETDRGYYNARMEYLYADVNFFGVSVSVQLPIPKNVIVGCDFKLCTVRIDITSADNIQLVLPARNAIKHSKAYTELLDRAINVWLQANADSEHEHYCHHKVYAYARDRGVDIGQAEAKLRTNPFYDAYVNAAGHVPIGATDFIIRGAHTDGPIAAAYKAAATAYITDKDGATSVWHGTFLRENPAMIGYAWYDAIPVLDAAVVTLEGTEYDYAAFRNRDIEVDCERKGDFYFVDGPIGLCLKSDTASLKMEMDVLIASDDLGAYYDGLEGCIYVTKRDAYTDANISDTVDAIKTAMFCEQDDYDAPDLETQQDNFLEESRSDVLHAMSSPLASVQYLIDKCIGNHMHSLRHNNMEWTMTKAIGSGQIVSASLRARKNAADDEHIFDRMASYVRTMAKVSSDPEAVAIVRVLEEGGVE